MNEASTATQLQYVLSAIVDWRLERTCEESHLNFKSIVEASEHRIRETCLVHFPSYRRFIQSLPEVDGRLVDHCIALIFLHFTELLEQGEDNSEIVKVIDELMQVNESSVSLQEIIRSSPTNKSFSRTTNILSKQLKTKVKSTNTMVQIELAKAFLRMSTDSNDVDQVHEDCLARVHLACLYYSTEQFKLPSISFYW